jgi:hypothetical protein
VSPFPRSPVLVPCAQLTRPVTQSAAHDHLQPTLEEAVSATRCGLGESATDPQAAATCGKARNPAGNQAPVSIALLSGKSRVFCALAVAFETYELRCLVALLVLKKQLSR